MWSCAHGFGLGRRRQQRGSIPARQRRSLHSADPYSRRQNTRPAVMIVKLSDLLTHGIHGRRIHTMLPRPREPAGSPVQRPPSPSSLTRRMSPFFRVLGGTGSLGIFPALTILGRAVHGKGCESRGGMPRGLRPSLERLGSNPDYFRDARRPTIAPAALWDPVSGRSVPWRSYRRSPETGSDRAESGGRQISPERRDRTRSCSAHWPGGAWM